MKNAFFQESGRPSKQIDLEELFTIDFLEYLRELLAAGVMVSAGLTRNGAAAHVTLFLEGEKRREWIETPDDMKDFLEAALRALSLTRPTPPAPLSEPERAKGQGSRRGAS